MVGNIIQDYVITLVALREIVLYLIDLIAPSEPTRSRLRCCKHRIRAPNDFTIMHANVPTPPDAPLIKTFWPG